jgi:cytochrome c biogenesis protein CcmG/thiol:disulfide interchange protein DsbE
MRGDRSLSSGELLVSKRFRRFLVLSLLAGLPGAARAQEAAPAVRLLDLYGNTTTLEAQRGHVVVLDFWASWCVSCRATFPMLNDLQARYSPKGLRVLGLTLEDSMDAIDDFLEAVPASFTIVRDPTGHAGEAFNVVAMPTTFLLDADGRIAARFEGGDKKTHARLEQAANILLSGEALAPGSDVRVAESLRATSRIKAWQRTYLADPMMNLDGDPISRMLHEHIHASKEGAAGDGGPAGGGCGCN